MSYFHTSSFAQTQRTLLAFAFQSHHLRKFAVGFLLSTV